MSLEAQLDRLNGNLENLIQVFASGQLAVPPAAEETTEAAAPEKKPARKPAKKSAPAKEEPPKEPESEKTEEPDTEPAAETELTEADVRKVLGDAARKKGSPFPKKLLGEFDCERLSDLDPSRYAEIIARAKKEAGV